MFNLSHQLVGLSLCLTLIIPPQHTYAAPYAAPEGPSESSSKVSDPSPSASPSASPSEPAPQDTPTTDKPVSTPTDAELKHELMKKNLLRDHRMFNNMWIGARKFFFGTMTIAGSAALLGTLSLIYQINTTDPGPYGEGHGFMALGAVMTTLITLALLPAGIMGWRSAIRDGDQRDEVIRQAKEHNIQLSLNPEDLRDLDELRSEAQAEATSSSAHTQRWLSPSVVEQGWGVSAGFTF